VLLASCAVLGIMGNRGSSKGRQAGQADDITRQMHRLDLNKKEEQFVIKANRPVRKNLAAGDGGLIKTTTQEQALFKARPYPSRKWTPDLDACLKAAVEKHGAKSWKVIAESVPGMTHVQCLQRWKKVLQPGLKKGPWAREEDEILMTKAMESQGQGPISWVAIAESIPGRTAKQCRERWSLNLDPTIDHSPWRHEEDRLLLELHKEKGNKWAEIAGKINGRTENAVKTRFKSLERAQQKAWTMQEDRAVINAKLTYGGKWYETKLPSRSKNAVRQRWKFLIKQFPNLEEAVARGGELEDVLPPQLRLKSEVIHPPSYQPFPKNDTSHQFYVEQSSTFGIDAGNSYDSCSSSLPASSIASPESNHFTSPGSESEFSLDEVEKLVADGQDFDFLELDVPPEYEQPRQPDQTYHTHHHQQQQQLHMLFHEGNEPIGASCETLEPLFVPEDYVPSRPASAPGPAPSPAPTPAPALALGKFQQTKMTTQDEILLFDALQ